MDQFTLSRHESGIIISAAFDRLVIVEGGESEEGGFVMPTGIYPRLPANVRFWSKVDKTDVTGCWLWTAGKGRTGYGTFHHAG